MSGHWLERDAVLTTMKRIIEAREHDCAVMDGMVKGRDAEIESLRSQLNELREAAGKVTCAECANSGEILASYGELMEPGYAPCPDCADLRRLLGEQP